MPRTRSKLNLSERRERAYELFARGYTNRDVAKELNVSKDTVGGYRRRYEESVQAQAAANPNFLKEVLSNTMRSLTELDQIRADAWKRLKLRRWQIEVECPNCEHSFLETVDMPVDDATRAQYLNVLLKAQDQRSKLFGVLGVKQEVFVAIMQTKTMADRVLEWMAQNLEGEKREALAEFVASQLPNQANILDAIDVEEISEAS